MPNIGGVFVPDNLMPTIAPAQPAGRPGFGAVLAGAASTAVDQIRYGLPYQAEKLAGTLTADREAEYQRGLAASQSNVAPASLDDLTSGRAGIGSFIGENIAASLPYMVGGLVGGIGGYALGGARGAIAGAVAGGTPQFSASNVARDVEENGALSTQGAARALAVAPFQAASDVLVERYLPGAGKVLGDLAATQAGGFLRRTATSMAKAGATEAITEAAQQMGERYAAGLNLGDADAAGEYVNAAVTALAVGGVLGAGGGFRRMNADAKPAEQVTIDDIDEKVNGVLDGTASRVQAPQQLALPAPADFTASPDGTITPRQPGTNEVDNSSGPPIVAPNPTDFIVDSQGNAVTPQQANDPETAAFLANSRINSGAPFSQAQIDAVTQPPAQPEITAPNVLAQQGQPFTPPPAAEAPQVQIPESARPYRADSLADLDVALRAKGDAPQIAAMRETAQAEIASRYAEAAGLEPLSSDFSQRLEEVKTGLRGGWITNLEATDPADLMSKVRERLESDTSANVRRLGERLGLVDAEGNATPVAQQINAAETAALQAETQAPAPAPVAPVTPEPASAAAAAAVSPEQVTSTSGSPQVQMTPSAAPAPVMDAEASAMQALGADPATGRGSGLSTAAEAEARRLGLITDNDAMDITPKGRQAYLRTPDAPAAIAAAAEQQGLTGAQATLFDRGVQAALAGDTSGSMQGNFADAAAYEAGRIWAQDFVENGSTVTAAQTRAIQLRQDARETVEGTPIQPGERRQLTPAQINQQSLSRLLDAADLSGASESDVATLIRAARTADNPAAFGEMIQHVQQGGELFVQPDTQEVVLTTPRDGRGQPVFREMNTPERGATRAANRAETQTAIDRKREALRQEVKAAFDSADISQKQLIGLLSRLRQGDFSGVIDRLPGGPLENQMNVSRRDFLAGVAASAVTAGVDAAQAKVGPLKQSNATGQLRAYMQQGNITATLQHIANHSADTGYRQIARKLLANGGWDLVDMAADADQGSLYGTTRLNEDGTSSVRLYGENGLTEETVLHELLHAYIQQRWSGLSTYLASNKELLKDSVDRKDDVLNQFRSLWSAIGSGLSKDGVTTEEAWAQNFHADPDEALSWIMTNKQAQAYLKSRAYNPDTLSLDKLEPGQKSAWSQFVDWLRGLVGLPANQPAIRTALDEIMDAGHSVIDAGADVRTGDFSKRFAEALATQNQELRMDRDVGTRTAADANTAAREAVSTLGQAWDRLNPKDLAVRSRRLLFGALSHNQIERGYGDQVPAIAAHREAHQARTALRSRWEQMFTATHQKFNALETANPKVAEKVGRVMATATELNLDPARSWDEHFWLEEGEKARLKPVYDEMQKLTNDLKRGDGAGWQVFNEFRQLNEAQNYARMATDLYGHVAVDPELQAGMGGWANPADSFMTADGVVSPEQVREYWDNVLDDQVKAARDFITSRRGMVASASQAEQRATAVQLSPIEQRIDAIYEARKAMQRAPYFHLGRFGDNFGSATIKTGEDGTVDPVAQRKVAAALEAAGFTDVQISADNTKPKLMMRFDKVDQATRFQALAKQLEAQGLLEKDSVLAGPRNTETFGTASEMPQFLRSYLQNLENSPMFAEDIGMTEQERADLRRQMERMKQLAIDTYVENQPDSAISKVLTKRYTVAGYNKDMIRNAAHRWRVGAINLANVASAPKFNSAFTEMQAQYNESLSASDPRDPYTVQDVRNELKARDAQTPVNDLADAFDKARGIAHSYFLGFSPAYGMINMTQLGVTALPEMAKTHGYAKSFSAMRRATPKVMAVLKAVAKEATKQGWRNVGDIAITEDVLKNAGLSDQDRGFIQHMMATGTIDIGSMARSLAQVADNKGVGGKLETYLKMSSVIGLYTETASRLVTALSARELHGSYDKAAQDYASKVVSESMFDYQSWNTARQLGKKGFLGPVTPIVTQFMSYQVQLAEKLYSEARDAIGSARPGESPESAKQRRTEAQRYLAGHLTAVTALTGTLGLPFASAFARALEGLVDTFGDDDEPFDATAAWRGFLADTLGKDAGEVLARGLPRAAGFDISKRAGEDELIPGIGILTDRRSWKDAVADSSSRSIGAVPSMAINILDGGMKIWDGDVLGGMKDMLPIAFKGPTEVYRMTTDGYVDTKGNKLPMSPTSSAILWQLLGFSPAAKAEYSEARQDQAVRRGEIARRAGSLRQGITRALANGDREQATALINDALKFDQDNPSFAVIPSIGASLQRQMAGQAMSRATATPMGVSMKDVAGQQLTGYANF